MHVQVLALGCDSVYAPGSEEPGAKGGERYAVHYTEYAVYYSTQVSEGRGRQGRREGEERGAE